MKWKDIEVNCRNASALVPGAIIQSLDAGCRQTDTLIWVETKGGLVTMGRTRSYLAPVILVCAAMGSLLRSLVRIRSSRCFYQVSGKITSSDGTPIDDIRL